MSDSPRNHNNSVSESVADGDDYSRARYPQITLRSVVVRYEERPDRCTVYPRRERCCERVDAWLSADADAFVPLEEMR
ncbi:DUF7511 domain-containing protein [Halobellus sp. GM3]|uniref:DUF7511 domain-containing protein n=1 Tax=Halobellus sp. GM3 TaxID=3458410 RepID=UPI00403D673C